MNAYVLSTKIVAPFQANPWADQEVYIQVWAHTRAGKLKIAAYNDVNDSVAAMQRAMAYIKSDELLSNPENLSALVIAEKNSLHVTKRVGDLLEWSAEIGGIVYHHTVNVNTLTFTRN